MIPTTDFGCGILMRLPILCALSLSAFFLIAVNDAHASGTNIGRPPIFGDGIACDARLLPWRSVWYGHFSGGGATYIPNAPAARLYWHDEKLCFPSRRACMRWQHAERRLHHAIRGDWTCLPLR